MSALFSLVINIYVAIMLFIFSCISFIFDVVLKYVNAITSA